MYIYISIYIFLHIYTTVYIRIYIAYIYIYICNHDDNNEPSRLLPQWPYGNSWTWAHDVQLYNRTSCAQVHELP